MQYTILQIFFEDLWCFFIKTFKDQFIFYTHENLNQKLLDFFPMPLVERGSLG